MRITVSLTNSKCSILIDFSLLTEILLLMLFSKEIRKLHPQNTILWITFSISEARLSGIIITLDANTKNTHRVSLKGNKWSLHVEFARWSCFLSHESGRLWRPLELPELCWCLGGSRHRQLWLRAQLQFPQEAHCVHQSQRLHRLDQLCKLLKLKLNHLMKILAVRTCICVISFKFQALA